jgi:hypothetical protein
MMKKEAIIISTYSPAYNNILKVSPRVIRKEKYFKIS